MNSLKKEKLRVLCLFLAFLTMLVCATEVRATIYLSDSGWSDPTVDNLDPAIEPETTTQNVSQTIYLSDSGWSKPVGDWIPATKTGTLNQDVTETIQIISDGITLDGNGHWVTGTGTGNGVYASYRSSVTIKNLNVSKFFFGIYLRLCSNCTLSGNTASNNRYGIYLYGSGNNELKDNTCEYNTSFGIYLASSGSNTINNNNSSSNKADGIYLSNSSNNNTVTSNTCNSNSNYGISLSSGSNNNTITANTVEYNTYFGIYVSSCSYNTLTNNTCISNASIGIYLSACSDNTLTNNTCNSNTFNGISLVSNSINNTITANTVSNNRHGIYLYVSSNNILNDNTCEYNTFHGIYLASNSNSNTINNNMCNSNTRFGIYLLSASNDNVISGNTVLDNAILGINLYNSSGNQIYNNSFIDNITQASVSGGGGNIFNLAAPTGGNFWSNWTGPDTDHDGFVDNPYVFTGGQDNLPWTKQDGWLNEPPVANAGDDLTVEATGPDGAVVTLDASDSTDPDSTPGTNDDIVSFDWYEGSTLIGSGETINYTFRLGTHTVTLVVTDSAGETSEDEVVITVQDTTPPTIYNILANPSVLWPPNHKMVEVTVTVDYDDICDPAPEVWLESITMNEGDETNTYNPEFDTTIGDGHTTDDIQVDEDGVIYLRAERSGTGTGRLYTLTYKATDFAGNVATATVTVTVPHDQS